MVSNAESIPNRRSKPPFGVLFCGKLAVLGSILPEAPSIFRASFFGQWVVAHSLAASYVCGHRPAV